MDVEITENGNVSRHIHIFKSADTSSDQNAGCGIDFSAEKGLAERGQIPGDIHVL